MGSPVERPSIERKASEPRQARPRRRPSTTKSQFAYTLPADACDNVTAIMNGNLLAEKSGGRSDIAFIVGGARLAGAALGARGFLLVGFGLLGAGVAADRRRQSVERNAFEVGARAVDRSDDAARRFAILPIAAIAATIAVVAV